MLQRERTETILDHELPALRGTQSEVRKKCWNAGFRSYVENLCDTRGRFGNDFSDLSHPRLLHLKFGMPSATHS